MHNKWQKISEEEIITNSYRKIIKKRFKMPNGSVAEFDIKKEGKVVSVLALTPQNQVILVKEYRPGPEKELLELPGGNCEADEDPLTAIKREFLEETGYTGKFIPLGKAYQCAYSSRVSHYFLATECFKQQEQQLEQNEFAEVILMSLEEFKQHLKTGDLTDPDTAYAALYYLKTKNEKT